MEYQNYLELNMKCFNGVVSMELFQLFQWSCFNGVVSMELFQYKVIINGKTSQISSNSK